MCMIALHTICRHIHIRDTETLGPHLLPQINRVTAFESTVPYACEFLRPH
jgi:hypothetical protein